VKGLTILRCSLCATVFRAAHAVDTIEPNSGRYCGASCLDAMRAVDAVRKLRDDDAIADALLAAYRRGGGPHPALVLASVQRVYTARGTTSEAGRTVRTCRVPLTFGDS
jgi:hypothetical protein